ncbi:helix-turn-helix domain-containing protein [Streptomyces anatolicus]|uniref:helix-turn-helix domain-containing protein n=1 Tax=Streptomyces anatolicus TaxID=2675858 RepID=UPI003557CF6B
MPLTSRELAGTIGVSREMVARLLRDLRASGALITKGRTLVVVRPDVLRRVAALPDSEEDAHPHP